MRSLTARLKTSNSNDHDIMFENESDKEDSDDDVYQTASSL